MCKGANTKKALDELYVFIEKGTPNGHEEKYKDAADEQVDVRAGDVTFRIQQLPHALFTREGDNLRIRKEITLKEALLGFEFKIKHSNSKGKFTS